MRRLKAFGGRILFDHLPKTGGSAVAQWFQQELGSGCVSPHIDDCHQALISKFGGLYSVLCAHVSYTKAEGLDPRYTYVTLLRDPLDRALSWLFFVSTNHNERDLRGLVPLVRRFLASEGADVPERLLPHISNAYVDHFCRVDGDGAEGDEVRLANAREALRQYDLAGVYEQMPQFIAQLSELLNSAAAAELEHVNVTARRPKVTEISGRLRERLLELNALDIALYREVRARSADRPSVRFPADTLPWRRYARAPEYGVQTGDVAISLAGIREGREVDSGSQVHFDLDLHVTRPVPQLLIGIHIKDSASALAYGVNSGMLEQLSDGIKVGLHRVTFCLKLTLPAGRYTAGFAVAEMLEDTQRDLAWHDSLCDFEVRLPLTARCIGYADLSARLEVAAVPAPPNIIIARAPGALRPTAAPASMRCNQRYQIPALISNRGKLGWHSGGPRPVMLSYHWLDERGAVRVFDGVRTVLPAAGLAPGASAPWHADVEAPAIPGSYILVLTMLQETVAWFETMDFEPARIAVQVVN
jgi:hypothetical protein